MSLKSSPEGAAVGASELARLSPPKVGDLVVELDRLAICDPSTRVARLVVQEGDSAFIRYGDDATAESVQTPHSNLVCFEDVQLTDYLSNALLSRLL